MPPAEVAVRNTEDVPRRPPRSPDPDAWAAWRVAHERERNGWTQTELARLVTEAGAPIRQQTIWEIENRNPPRRISLSEAIAFSKVFDIDLEQLGAPPEEVVRVRVADLKQERRDWRTKTDQLISLLHGLRTQPALDPATYQAIKSELREGIDSVSEAAGEVRASLDADYEDVGE